MPSRHKTAHCQIISSSSRPKSALHCKFKAVVQCAFCIAAKSLLCKGGGKAKL